MGLLTPAFLIGLAALAVPLLIHLIRRERHDAVEFPSLMFLSRIPQPVVKRRSIRNWWLFALRCFSRSTSWTTCRRSPQVGQR